MGRTSTWNNIGKSVEECKDLEAVLKASGLDYEVEKRPLFMRSEQGLLDQANWTSLDNRFVTVRKGTDHYYDVVSDKYEIIQNKDAFDFVNYMGEDLLFEKAGETKSGMVYIIGKLPEVSILGDAFTPHVIFRNGFGGKVKIQAAICPLRIVCQNQFNFSFKNTDNTVNIRHVANAETKLAEAREVLKLSADYMQELNTTAEKYANIKLGQFALDRLMKQMFPASDAEGMNSFKRKRLEEAKIAFTNAYNADDNANFRGTAWGMVNAYTDYITHKVPTGKSDTKEENKFITTTFKVASMNDIFKYIDAVATV